VRRVATIVLVIGAVGCTAAPAYRRPPVPMPDAWRLPVETTESLGDAAWWDVLHDPALQDLIRSALDANTDVRLAAARVLQAEAQLRITRANQLPEVNGTADVGRQRTAGRVATGSGTSGAAIAFNTAGLGANVSYIVDFWGQYRQATQAARATLLATRAAQTNVAITIISTVAQAYFQLRALDAQLAVTERTVATLQESQRLTEVLFRGGIRSELDVRQAESAVEIAQANVPALQRSIAIQENLLSQLAGRVPGDVRRGSAIGDQVLPPEVPAGVPSHLLQRRPDVLQAEQQLIAAYANVGVARAQLFPQLALTASGGIQSTALGELLSAPAGVYSLLANLAAPLYAGGRLRANVRLAQAQRQEALISYEAAVLQSLRDVSNGLVSYQRTREELAAQQALVATNQRAVELSTLRYRGGVGTFLEVLDAERQLFNAELSVAQTQGAVLVALAQLYQALGGGWIA
jgi:multidrug efflux system outer membrane protein